MAVNKVAAGKGAASRAAAGGPDLRAFTIDYFTFFNATVRPLDKRKQGSLAIDLPADLAEHFGKTELRVGFHEVTPGGDLELIAHGSRLFDRMLALLDRRGALTLQTLPSRHAGSEELLAAVRPVNASIAGLKMQETLQTLAVFNWRITYRADDKREEIYTVVMDDQGRRVPLAGEANAGADALDLDALWPDAQPAPPETNADGQPIPARLPPMTHLARLAENARKYAVYHADLRSVAHEAEILPRLYQVLNRLTTYYGQQIEEVYESHDPDGEKRRELEEDLQRKIAEEVENHRLRVQMTLFSYALVQMPVAVAEIELSDGTRQATVEVTRNRYTGALHRPVCHACGNETTVVALDRNGHITCDDCIRQCDACQGIYCAECGVATCPVCGKQNCATCGQTCWACGERACAEHVQRCPVCGDAVCLTCQAPCAVCGTLQCRSHLRADAVAAADGSHPLVCGECAVRCPGCNQYSAQLAACEASGQRFCANCLVTCAVCGKRVGPGFYQTDPATHSVICHTCMGEGPTCGKLTTQTAVCAKCGKTGCSSCLGRCDACRARVCREHLVKVRDCGHVICADHHLTCAIGGEPVCPVCTEPCPICDRPACAEHARVCRRCGQVYCQDCMARSGLCETCAGLDQAGVAVKLEDEPWAADARVALIAPHYRWRRVGNRRFTIFVGENNFFARAVIVVDRAIQGGRVVHVRRLGAEDRLRDLFGD